AGADRRHPGSRRTGRLSSGPLRPRRFLPTAGNDRRGEGLLSGTPGPHAAGAGAAVSGRSAGGAGGVKLAENYFSRYTSRVSIWAGLVRLSIVTAKRETFLQ